MDSRERRTSRRQVLFVLAGTAAALGGSRVAGQQSQESEKAVDSRVPAEIRRIIIDQLDVEPANVKWDSCFVDDLGAESLDIVELFMALEEEFRIEIPDEEAETLTRVRDLVEYLRKRGVLK